MPKRIVVDVQTGDRQDMDMTAQELAGYVAGATEETDQKRNRPPSFEERLRACERALGL